jgi:RND family efflux transporter MFP subunit
VSPAAVTVKAETTGRVLRFPKEEGDRISAGEIVVWVDDSHEAISLRQADTGILVAKAAVERARIVQRHASAEWTRAQNLLQSGGITDRDFKAAELAERDATAQLAVSTAQLEQAQAQFASAKRMLEESVVRAPVSGEIQAKLTAVGAYVEPATPVFLLVDNNRLELEAMVATANLGSIRAGQKMTFRVNVYPAEQFVGRVIDINPAVQADTRSAKVRLGVDNGRGRLKAGMFAQGEILTGIEREAILVPAGALYRDDRSLHAAHLFIIQNGRASRRQVTLGQERDSTVEILTGLTTGEIVALEQSIELADGVAVTPDLGPAK